MSCPYHIRIDNESRPVERARNLFRAIRQRHGNARHVHNLGEHARVRHADALQQATGGVCGKREHDPVRLVRRATSDSYPPAVATAREAGNTLCEPQGPSPAPEPLAERDDRLAHPLDEASKSCSYFPTFRL